MATTPPAENLTAEDLKFIEQIHAVVLNSQKSFTAADIAKQTGLEIAQAERYLQYLAALIRECEPSPRLKGVAQVLIQGEIRYEPLSDNPDVRRDYDFRATNEGGRDFCPKNMFYYVWAWLNMAEKNCETEGLPNNRTILVANDCRYYPEQIIEAARQTALLRGYRVVSPYVIDKMPSCVSSFSHAVRVVKPVVAVMITASHVSRPLENTVVGAKVSMLAKGGRLESLATKEIKTTTAEELRKAKASNDLYMAVKPVSDFKEIVVADSHTLLAKAAGLAVLGRLPSTLYVLAQQLKTAADIDALLRTLIPSGVEPPFQQIKVVIEAAHTSSGILAKMAFDSLGAHTTVLNGDVFPIQGFHTADPSITDNLTHLFAEMKKQSAHMGLAFDLDGDRGAIVLLTKEGQFTVLAPDKLGQVLMPFLMNEGGYNKAPKPLYVRDCLSTDALLDQGTLSNVTVDTTDSGYVFLKKRESDRSAEGFLTISMCEASGHAWLDYTGPFENPIVLSVLFAALCVKRFPALGFSRDKPLPTYAMERVFTDTAIPYRKSSRFQPLFSSSLIAEVARTPENDTGWKPESDSPIPQKVINLCRSVSVMKLRDFFKEGRVFETPLGALKVDQFETQWDERERIYRFGKIYFSLNGSPVGSFVSRSSSNDPTAVQVWEVKEFEGPTWKNVRLTDEAIKQRYDLIGNLVLSNSEGLGILELVDRKPAVNMAEVLKTLQRG